MIYSLIMVCSQGKKTIELQRSNHVNMIFSWNTPGSSGNLTMKLYEYLAARRKVMVIMNGHRDPEFDQILEKTQSGLQLLIKDTELMVKYLKELYQDPILRMKLNPEIPLQSLTWESQIRKLYRKIETLSS